MENSKKTVFEFVKHALKHQNYVPYIENEREVYQILFENGLIGLCYETLEKIDTTDHFKETLKKDFYAFVSYDERQKLFMNEILNILNTHAIDFIFLKGAKLKQIYPSSYMRGMGDIDILVKDEHYKSIKPLFKKFDINLKSSTLQHDSYQKYHLITEIHPTLYKDFNNHYQKLMSDTWSHTNHIFKHEYTLKIEYEICYLLYHLAKHMDTSGIGLRSILDIGVYLNAFEHDIDKDVLDAFLKKSHLQSFYDTMLLFNKHFFGFRLETLESKKTLSDEELGRIATYITKSGIHGHGQTYNPYVTGAASQKVKNRSKMSYVLSILFPKFEEMKVMYPFISKFKPLILFAWVLRWVKLLFIKPKSSVRKLKQLQISDDELQKSVDLLKLMGLT
jgi:hypothetical protein